MEAAVTTEPTQQELARGVVQAVHDDPAVIGLPFGLAVDASNDDLFELLSGLDGFHGEFEGVVGLG